MYKLTIFVSLFLIHQNAAAMYGKSEEIEVRKGGVFQKVGEFIKTSDTHIIRHEAIKLGLHTVEAIHKTAIVHQKYFEHQKVNFVFGFRVVASGAKEPTAAELNKAPSAICSEVVVNVSSPSVEILVLDVARSSACSQATYDAIEWIETIKIPKIVKANSAGKLSTIRVESSDARLETMFLEQRYSVTMMPIKDSGTGHFTVTLPII